MLIDIRFSSLARTLGSLVDEIRDFLEPTDGEYFLCCLQVGVRNQVAVLCEQVVDRDFFLVLIEYANPSCEVCKWVINFSRSV